MNFAYPAIPEPDSNGTFLVSFPDVPEAASFGDDVQEALLRAADALESALEEYIEEGRDLPDPARVLDGQHLVQPRAQACLAFSVYSAMRQEGVRKAELARRLGWHMPQIDRLLNPRHATRMDKTEQALRALGRSLKLEVGRAT